jgi:deazaflavin-dependent oxidoreductase (nitroreductase family)
MAHEHSDLRTWIGRLRDGDADAHERDVDDLDREALDNAVGFAAEHARRYVATSGADDGWDGPRPIVLLYTTGRRSGKVRRNPLLCFEHDGERYVIGSKGGAERAPEWYLNLTAAPGVHVRFGPDLYEADAVTIDDDERTALWPELVARYPMFDDYQRTTTRQIPLVRLVPRSADAFAALEELAAGMRRLNRAVAGRRASDDELRSLARTVTSPASSRSASVVGVSTRRRSISPSCATARSRSLRPRPSTRCSRVPRAACTAVSSPSCSTS